MNPESNSVEEESSPALAPLPDPGIAPSSFVGASAVSVQELERVLGDHALKYGFPLAHSFDSFNEARSLKETGVAGLRLISRGRFYCRRRKNTCPFFIKFHYSAETKKYLIKSECLEHNHDLFPGKLIQNLNNVTETEKVNNFNDNSNAQIVKYEYELTKSEQDLLFMLGPEQAAIPLPIVRKLLSAVTKNDDQERKYDGSLLYRLIKRGKEKFQALEALARDVVLLSYHAHSTSLSLDDDSVATGQDIFKANFDALLAVKERTIREMNLAKKIEILSAGNDGAEHQFKERKLTMSSKIATPEECINDLLLNHNIQLKQNNHKSPKNNAESETQSKSTMVSGLEPSNLASEPELSLSMLPLVGLNINLTPNDSTKKSKKRKTEDLLDLSLPDTQSASNDNHLGNHHASMYRRMNIPMSSDLHIDSEHSEHLQ